MAKPFSLVGLLRLRALQEDQAAGEVSHARARAAEIASRRRFAENSLANLTSVDGNPENLRWTAVARAATASALTDLDALEAEWHLRMEDARVRHAMARASALALEKLEARHNEAEGVETLRAEQLALDEISARAWQVAREENPA